MRISGIYQIQSISHPERFYIGSAVDIGKRKGDHLCGLRNNKHDNSRLQRHFNKYGESDVVFTTLLGCDQCDLIKHEQFFIDSLKPFFNISLTAGRTTGYRHTKEMKEWFSKTRKGKTFSEQQKKNMGDSRIGRVMSDESKLKISITHLGMRHTEETKKKLSELRKGKSLSEEHRRSISKGLTGRIPTTETRMKISAANMGHIISEETKKKISIANTGRTHSMSIESRNKMSVARNGKKKPFGFSEYCVERERIKRLKSL